MPDRPDGEHAMTAEKTEQHIRKLEERFAVIQSWTQ
jgi:hypothetical protein